MRVFVAVNIPAHERDRLHAALAPLRELGLTVRWTAPESLHLTLKFLGSADERQVDVVKEIVADAAARSASFVLSLGGVGGFPDLIRPRVWWIGVERDPALAEVRARLEADLAAVGFPEEDRPFSPHITIGRARDRAARMPRSVADLAHTIDYRARVPIETIDLMRSHLNAGGARYERLLAAPLRVAASPERTRA
jgi:2'-5' RNA ligase